MPVPSSNDTFLDFWQKYLRNASTKGEESRGMKSLSRVVPAPIGEELTKRIQTMTCDIFKLLDCCGTVRVDFILDQNDMLFVNEPNTIPGSLAFYLWKAAVWTSPSSSKRWWKTPCARTRIKIAACLPMIPASLKRLRRAQREANVKK